MILHFAFLQIHKTNLKLKVFIIITYNIVLCQFSENVSHLLLGCSRLIV